MFTLIKRIFYSGWKSFFRDKETVVATIFVLFLAVMLVSSLFLFKDISQLMVSIIQEKIDISVYFKEQVTEKDILSIKEEISQFPEVKDIEYVSPEQALQNFVIRHEQEPVLIESIEELGRNPFLASLNIEAWEPSQYGKVFGFLENSDFESFIEKIDYYQRKSVIERISSLSSVIINIFIFLSVVLIIMAIAVTFNTIRLSIYNSSKEIKVQRLVGASNWFIQGPFLVQGAICGVLAGFISLLVFSAVCLFLSPRISSFFFGLNLFELFVENFRSLLLIQFATGIGLGIISSSVAIRKYLEV